MNGSMMKTVSCLFAVLLLASACTTSNTALTENPAGNYTANVKPYGSSGR